MATPKFKALVHFIVHECRDHPARLGAVRLNKSLWNTDVIAYKQNGTSVTGETYVKRRKGPVPAHILATLRELEAEGKIVIQEPTHQFDPRKYISMKAPTVDLLSDEERALASAVVDSMCGFTANAVSEMTHDIVWDAAADGEEIPLFATLASEKGEITEATKQWAAGVVQGLEGVAE